MSTIVQKTQCARCPRVEEEVLSIQEAMARLEEPELKPTAAVTVVMRGTKVLEFDHLCEVCTGIVHGYIESVAAKLEKASSRNTRTKAKVA